MNKKIKLEKIIIKQILDENKNRKKLKVNLYKRLLILLKNYYYFLKTVLLYKK